MSVKTAPQTHNILIIDDDKLVIASLEKVLKTKGHRITTATSGKQGIDLASNGTFDLIISDIRMPDINGVDTVSRIKEIYREQDKQCSFMFVTGYAEHDVSQKAANLGMAEFIMKPFDIGQFLASVDRELLISRENKEKVEKTTEVIPEGSLVGKWKFPHSKFEIIKPILLKQTNLMGNTYFANYIEWQGETRESLLLQHPSAKEWLGLNQHIKMITHSLNHRFFHETTFGDIVKIELTSREIKHCSFILVFRYFNVNDQKQCGEGWQKVCFSDFRTSKLCPVPRLLLDLAEPIQE